MEITKRFVGGLTILDLIGRFAIGSTDTESPSLRTLVGELVGNGRVAVLIHLARVTDMDAHALGELVWSFTALDSHGGQMALIAPSPRVRRLLAVTRLDTVFAVFGSELEAFVSTGEEVVPGLVSPTSLEHHFAL